MKTKQIIIIEQAAKLFSKYGIKGISMDEVAKGCGMSKRTIYEVIGTKDQLVAQTLTFISDRDQYIIEQTGMRKQKAIEEMLLLNRHINQWVNEFSPRLEFDLKKYFPSIFQKMNEQRKQRLYKLLTANMQKGKKEGIYRKDINEDVIARLFITRITNITNQEMFSQEEIASPDFYNEIFMYHIQGILNDKGREQFFKRFHGSVEADLGAYQYSFIPAS